MKLSVIVPVHNGAASIEALLQSLQPQIGEGVEVIVVDDASSDATSAILARHSWVRTVRHDTNRGAGAARNTGAGIARGEILLFVDADTVATPALLGEVMAFLEARPALAAASGVYCERNLGGHAFARYLDATQSAMRRGCLDAAAPGSLSGSLCAIRRGVFRNLGGFSEDRRAALEDVELGLRLSRAGYTHWVVGNWRVAHRQPAAWHRLKLMAARSRHYVTLLHQFGTFNEIMGGRTEAWARLAYAACLGLLPLALLLPQAGMPLLALAVPAAWLNCRWMQISVRQGGPRMLGAAMGFHAATTFAIGWGALRGALDLASRTLARHLSDAAVVAAYLRSLVTPGAGGYLIQFLTHRCPARCGHCFDHPQRAEARRADELSVARIQRIAGSAGPLAHVSLTGGEPLLRDDLPEIILAWYGAGVRSISLSTSAAYPEKLAAVLAQTLPQTPRLRLMVTLSVDALGSRHDVLRGLPGLFAKVEETLSRLQTLRTFWPQLHLHACLTLSANNAATAEQTLNWLARWRCDEIELNLLRGKPADASTAAPADTDYVRIRALAERLNGRNTGLARLFSRLDLAMHRIVRHWQQPWPSGPCLAGKRLAVVLANGEVLPCEMLRSTRPRELERMQGYTLGNLAAHDDDLRALLTSDRARRITDHIEATQCRCSFECAIFTTLAYRPWKAIKLMVDRQKRCSGGPMTAPAGFGPEPRRASDPLENHT